MLDIAAPAWRFACPDWQDRLAAGRSLMPDLPLDPVRSAKAVALCNRLRLPDVEGMPTMAEAGGDWFREIVAAVFGSLDPSTNRRQVPGVFLMVPKKNGKTTYSAAFMVVALLLNRRPAAQFALFGPTQEVADLAFAAAKGMIEADPEIAALLHVQDHLKTIRVRAGHGRNSKLKITTFDPKVATGGKFAGWLLDEAHLLDAVPYATRVVTQMRGAAVAIPEQFGVIITTQAENPPAGFFKAELDYARAVRDGLVEDAQILPLLYEFPDAIQSDPAKPWRNPALWHQVLPNLGRSVSIDVLQRLHRAAMDKGPEHEQLFASQHLNIQPGMRLHHGRWIGADHWAAAAEELSLDTLLSTSEVCTIGIDGGGLDDLFAVCVMGRCARTKAWRAWVRAWAHPEVLDARKEIAPALRDFAAAGDLTLCTEATQDIREAAALVAQVKASGLLPRQHAIGLDPFAIGPLVDELGLAGIGEDEMVAITQGSKLSPAVWTLERKLKDLTFRPSDQPLFAWSVSNARTVQRGNAVLITKEVAGKAKIDPLVACFNAATLMGRNPVANDAFEYTGL